jgi:hypothetical protein
MTSTQFICANLENLWMKILVGFLRAMSTYGRIAGKDVKAERFYSWG